MQTATKPTRKRKMPWIVGILMVATLALLVVLQATPLWRNFTISSSGDLLLLYALSSLNFAAFIIFGFIFLRSIVKLLRERRTFQLGAKIKTRLLIYFVALSLLPIIAMAAFSYLFLNRALERWFTQIPVTVISEAQEVQRNAIADRAGDLDDKTRIIAAAAETSMADSAFLERFALTGSVAYLGIYSDAAKPIEFRSRETDDDPLISELAAAAAKGDAVEPRIASGSLYDASSVVLPDGRRLVVVAMPVGKGAISLAVESSASDFEFLKQQELTIRQVGLLTLGVLTFLLIFASMWIAFHVARGLTEPIRSLAEGAAELGRGNFGHRVEVLAEDELEILVRAFNEMSATLEANSAELLERRRYIETVVETLPTGVISFDADGRISTINRAAIKMLRLEDADFSGHEAETIFSETDRATVDRILARARRAGSASDQVELKRVATDGNSTSNNEMPAALTASALPDGNGVVLVIEDLSELISAQRASAWQEVARRMAHEIKNPLTPIQLSAERIARRLLPAAERGSIDNSVAPNTDERTQTLVADGTSTIIREVQSLKAMVDEFSRFARLPEVVLKRGDIATVLKETARLYTERTDEIELTMSIDDDLPAVLIDLEQLKRVFINLIDNSIEAKQGGRCAVMIGCRFDGARELVIVEVSDDGDGIAPADIQKLFQPYFSTKGRGTGLGLAIVHRIVSEHRGKIHAGTGTLGGAKFTIELPAVDI